jgi:hypothetical protein
MASRTLARQQIVLLVASTLGLGLAVSGIVLSSGGDRLIQAVMAALFAYLLVANLRRAGRQD